MAVHHCTANPCPLCNPPGFQLGRVELVPKGCICPPGSEQTCQRVDCGRRSVGALSPYNTCGLSDGAGHGTASTADASQALGIAQNLPTGRDGEQ